MNPDTKLANTALSLPRTLTELLSQASVKPRVLALQCEVSPSTIYNILDGDRCSPETLKLIIEKLPELNDSVKGDRHIKDRILFAYLYDEALRAGVDSDEIAIYRIDGASKSLLHISPEFNQHLCIIARNAATDKNIAQVLDDLADMLAQKEARLATIHDKIIQFPTTDASVKVAETPAAYPSPSDAAQILSNERARRNQAKRDSSKSSASSSS